MPYNENSLNKRWVTDDFASPVLYEYENERELLNKKQNIKYYIFFKQFYLYLLNVYMLLIILKIR